MRALEPLYVGTGPPMDSSARARLMADSLRRHQDRLDPDTRIVLMAHAESVPELYPDADHEFGFAVTRTAMAPPPPGSVEYEIGAAGLGDDISLCDLRPLRHDPAVADLSLG